MLRVLPCAFALALFGGCSLGLDFDEIPACAEDELFDEATGTCACPPTQVRSTADRTCGCPDTRMVFDGFGACICPDGEVFDGQACICDKNLTRDASTGGCACPDARMMLDSAGVCQCPDGYVAEPANALPTACSCPTTLPEAGGIFDLDGDRDTCEGALERLGTVNLDGNELVDVALKVTTNDVLIATVARGLNGLVAVSLVRITEDVSGDATIVEVADASALFEPDQGTLPEPVGIALIDNTLDPLPVAVVAMTSGPPLVADFVDRTLSPASVQSIDGLATTTTPDFAVAGVEGLGGSSVLVVGRIDDQFRAVVLTFSLVDASWQFSAETSQLFDNVVARGPNLACSFSCDDNTCLDADAVCDGIQDCAAGEDEWVGLCGPAGQCPPGQLPCAAGNCAPEFEVCEDGAGGTCESSFAQRAMVCSRIESQVFLTNPVRVAGTDSRFVASGVGLPFIIRPDGVGFTLSSEGFFGTPVLVELEFDEDSRRVVGQAAGEIPDLAAALNERRATIDTVLTEIGPGLVDPPLAVFLASTSGSGSELVSVARVLALGCISNDGLSLVDCGTLAASDEPLIVGLKAPSGIVRYERTPDSIEPFGQLAFRDELTDVLGVAVVEPSVVGLEPDARLVLSATLPSAENAALVLQDISGETPVPRFSYGYPSAPATTGFEARAVGTDDRFVFLPTASGVRVLRFTARDDVSVSAQP